MLDYTSLNVWIQCIESGDFTANSEWQQSTEGVQAWRWAAVRSICKITDRWREFFLFVLRVFCLHFFFFYLLVFSASKSVPISLFLCGCSSLQMLSVWLLADFCKQFVKEKVSNECDFATEAVWKSAGFVKWDVCIYHILVLFVWIQAYWATGSDNHHNPLQISPFILASCWNHRKHSALIFENKKAWLTPYFLQALCHF